MRQICAFLPGLQEDETIYSWCATVHAMSGWRNSQEWSLVMLGARHAPRQLDLPSYLPGLLRTTLHHLNLEQALRRHTTAGMFMPFVKEDLLDRLRTLGGAPTVDWPNTPQFLRRALFCHSRSLSWKPELRYCPDCARTDVSRIGRPYWHTHHQWPLSRYCSLHQRTLVPVKASAKTWQLPPSHTEKFERIDIQTEHLEIQSTVHRVTAAFSELDTINTKTLRVLALFRLKKMGVIHSMHAVRHARLHAWYRNQSAASWLASEHGGLTVLADPDWVPKLLWRRTQDHPIRWIILWSMLGWSNEESAVAALKEAVTGPEYDEQGQLPLFERTNLDFTTKPVEPTPAALQLALNTASSYVELMRQLQASRSDIVRWLGAHPIARKNWRERLQHAKIVAAEQTLTQLMKSKPQPRRSEINRVASKEIRFLRQHALERLESLLNAVPSGADVQRPLWLDLPLNCPLNSQSNSVNLSCD